MNMKNCEYCNRLLPVFDEENMVRIPFNRFKKVDETELYVEFVEDPFQSEIYHDETRHWLCQACVDEASMEI